MPITPANDHDLLVRLDAKLDALSASFAEVKLAVANKADAVRVDKLETTVGTLQNKVYAIGGGLAALEIALRLLLK